MPDGQAVEKRGVTRSVVRWLAQIYYPNIEISDADRIPQSGPVLLCANHANSLFDPVLIGVAARRPVRFMAKAPLFDHPLLGPPMSALGMIPAYRGSDDAGAVKRNLESLDVGAKVLVEGRAMGIFPEGKSTDQAHLEMVRSGAARMAIQASEEGAVGVQVIPIGITYERKDESRSSAWIQVGEPIAVDEWLEQHDGNVRTARRALTQQLESNLKDVVVHLDEPEWEPWLYDLQTLTEPPRDKSKEPVPPLKRRKRIADAMNYFLANDRARTESVAGDIKAYRDQVKSAGLQVDSPILRMHGLRVCAEWLWDSLVLILLFIPAVVGTLHHLVPFVIVRAAAARMDQPGQKTVSTNRTLVGLPVYLLWYLLVAWWTLGYFAAWYAWAWLIAAPFCGVIAIQYWRRGGRMAHLLWHQVRLTIRRDTLKRLRQQESELRDRLKELTEEYANVSPPLEAKTRILKRRRLARITARILVVLLVAAVGWVLKYQFFDTPLSGNGLDLKSVSAPRLKAYMGGDEKVIVQLIEGLDELEAEAIQMERDFVTGRRSFTRQADNDDLRELMRRYITYRESLLRIIWRYQQYADLDDEKLQLRAFLLEFTAAAMLYEASLKFIRKFGDNSAAITKLNEPEKNWGIPPGLYDTIRHNLASPQNIEMFKNARQYFHQKHVQRLFEDHGLAGSAPYGQFHEAVSDAEEAIGEMGGFLPGKIIHVAASDLGRIFHEVQYETQSAVSTWIGDFKIRQPHKGESLIDKEQLAELAALLQPGDILLERRNWYLSNAFLPGYWPHGAVYVGTADQLANRGLDRNKHVRKHWKEFRAKDPEGREHVIIEAVSEGVIFSSLEHSIGGADAVAVLRPNVSDKEKTKAIALAFSFAGRPYDFEFDFESTDMLVCTEVVFRTYGANSGTIKFPLETIMGRETMPAINLVQKFDREYGTDAAQFEFIAFLDGDEWTETSQFLDVEDFRGTLKRPASSFFQGGDPYALKSIGPLGWVLLSMTVLCAFVAVGTPLQQRIHSHGGVQDNDGPPDEN